MFYFILSPFIEKFIHKNFGKGKKQASAWDPLNFIDLKLHNFFALFLSFHKSFMQFWAIFVQKVANFVFK